MSSITTFKRRWFIGVLFGLALSCAVSFTTDARSADNIRALPSATTSNGYPISVNGFHVVDFKTENLVAPQGIDVANPRFSWKLFSQTIDEKQSAYQLEVTKADGGEVLWNSGRVESDQQLYIRYGGEPLAPATEYFVELNVWNKDGSKKSQIFAPFSTGLYPTEADPNPWKGKWIGLNSKEEQPDAAGISKAKWICYQEERDVPVGTSVYRKTFDIEDVDDVANAVANISADNRVIIYVNGVNIGGSDDFHHAPSRDLAPQLRTGKNVIALRVMNVGSDPNPSGALGSFYIAFKDGQKDEYFTDSSWKAIEGDSAIELFRRSSKV